MKTIGVLGGMGAETSAKFYQIMNTIFQEKYNAEQDTDFAKMIIYNCPLSGFTEVGIEDFEVVKSQLVQAVKDLEQMGADFIVIPCNTVHYFIKEMREAIEIPILSIIEETSKKISQEKIGIICSETTSEMKLYKNDNTEIIYPNEKQQLTLNTIIGSVIAGKQGKKETQEIIDIINSYEVNEVVLGCTELPLAIDQSNTDIKLLNTLQILAESAVDFSKQ